MPNKFIAVRLAGIQMVLNGVHQSLDPMTDAIRGDERAAFINSFLANVLPPIYRFGSGDVTDAAGHRSGQLDVVIEYPFSPSLPSFDEGAKNRLYLAESVAAVVEVKSNVAAQWSQARRTAEQLAPVGRNFCSSITLTKNVPLFVAGYTGWNTVEAVQQNLADTPAVAGVLVINPGIFVGAGRFKGTVGRGPWSLWGLIVCLHHITASLQAASTNPENYARQSLL